MRTYLERMIDLLVQMLAEAEVTSALNTSYIRSQSVKYGDSRKELDRELQD